MFVPLRFNKIGPKRRGAYPHLRCSSASQLSARSGRAQQDAVCCLNPAGEHLMAINHEGWGGPLRGKAFATQKTFDAQWRNRDEASHAMTRCDAQRIPQQCDCNRRGELRERAFSRRFDARGRETRELPHVAVARQPGAGHQLRKDLAQQVGPIGGQQPSSSYNVSRMGVRNDIQRIVAVELIELQALARCEFPSELVDKNPMAITCQRVHKPRPQRSWTPGRNLELNHVVPCLCILAVSSRAPNLRTTIYGGYNARTSCVSGAPRANVCREDEDDFSRPPGCPLAKGAQS